MASLVKRRTRKRRWQVRPEWESILFDSKGLKLPEWLAEDRVRRIKESADRTVHSVETGGRTFFVKHYRCDRFLEVTRNLIRVSRARREWRMAEEVARRGIPTIRPIAWMEERTGGIVRDSFFLSEAIAETCLLEQYLEPFLNPTNEQVLSNQLIESLARFVARVHERGILHDDFHIANLFLRRKTEVRPIEDPQSLWEFFLIDLSGVRFSKQISWPEARDHLTLLNASLWEWTTLTQRWRFWRTYLAARPMLDAPEPRIVAQQFDDRTRRHCRQVSRNYDQRAMRTNRDFVALRRWDGEAHAICGVPDSELIHLLERPERLIWQNLDRPVKLCHRQVVVEAEIPVGDRLVHVGYKHFHPQRGVKAFFQRFRSGRALRGWYLGHALHLRRIPTARPIAVCEISGPSQRWQGFLATEWIEGAEDLHRFGWRLARLSPESRHRSAVRCAESLGRMLGRMHAWYVLHGDLKGGNLLIVDREETLDTFVIDAEGVTIGDRFRFGKQAADLARLATSIQAHPWVSSTIGCRFFRAYSAQFPPGQIEWKRLWREVVRRSRKFTRRLKRRNEPVS